MKDKEIWWVNSDTGLSRNRVDEIIPDSKPDGSVNWSQIRDEAQDQTLNVGGTIGLRRLIQENYQDRGRTLSDRQAQRINRIMENEDWIKWVGNTDRLEDLIPVTHTSSCESFVKDWITNADKNRLANTKKRKKRNDQAD